MERPTATDPNVLELFIDWTIVSLDLNAEFSDPANAWMFIAEDVRPRAELLGLDWDAVLAANERIASASIRPA